MKEKSLKQCFRIDAEKYIQRLSQSLVEQDFEKIEELAKDIQNVWETKNKIILCGNGGSAANAIHIANDLHYGIGSCGIGPKIPGVGTDALPANSAIVTCLANDTGYENIYADQIKVKGNCGDILLVLSGSGNSKNIINAINAARTMNIKSHAILAFDGGKCKALADNVIHTPIDDMQVAEDIQLVIGHICMQWLTKNKPGA